MKRVTELAHDAVAAVVQPGEITIDATAGNGHDTLFLARLVGPTGRIFAFDNQPDAIARTTVTLSTAGVTHATVLHRDHAELADSLPPEYHGQIAAVMFNLGYLPGGDKSWTTASSTTLSAIQAGLPMLRAGGIVTIVAYPGHPGGDDEMTSVTGFLANLPATYEVQWPTAVEHTGPRLFIVRRKL